MSRHGLGEGPDSTPAGESTHWLLGRVAGAIAACAIVAGIAITVGGLLEHFAFDDSVRELDTGEEESLNNWLTVTGSYGAGLGALLLAGQMTDRRRALLTAAAIFVVISLDDAITLHERIGGNVGIDHIETLVFAPLYGYALFLVWRLSGAVGPRAGRLLRTSLVLLGAAIVVDLGSTVTVDLADEGVEWAQPSRIALEEGFEVSGWLLLAGTLLAMSFASFLKGEGTGGLRPNTAAAESWSRPLFWGSVAVGLGVALGIIGNHFALDNRIPDLDLEREVTLQNWLSVVASFTAALGAAVSAALIPSRRRLLLALAAIFLLLSIDDQILLHERIADGVGIDELDDAILAPLYLGGFVLAWLLVPALGAPAGILLRGGVLLLGAALALDLATEYARNLAEDGTLWPQRVRGGFEEGLKVAGWSLIAGALALLAWRHEPEPAGTSADPTQGDGPAPGGGGAGGHAEA